MSLCPQASPSAHPADHDGHCEPFHSHSVPLPQVNIYFRDRTLERQGLGPLQWRVPFSIPLSWFYMGLASFW